MTAELFCSHEAGLAVVSRHEANALLEKWGHMLGRCERPFGVSCWVLQVSGHPVSVAVGASTVSATVGPGWDRHEVVELARLCSDPAERWATRPMLRLWREVAAPLWPYWSAQRAVAYSLSRRHDGDLYRWDGWDLVADLPASGGGGTWSGRRAADSPAGGPKRLWAWEFNRAAD